MNSATRRTTSAAAGAVVLATAGGMLTALATPASAAVSCTSPVYKRQFFANTTFSGTPKKTDCDSTISENWGTGAPASGLPANNFSVRWTLTRDFGSGGPFAFTASAQDGIRVYLDGTRKIDLWKNVSSTVSKTVNLTIPSGKHTLRVDYVNWTGAANVKFAYSPRTSATVDKVKPLTPTGISVSYDKATGKAKLAWSKNKEMDLAGYRVYRRPKGGSYPAKPLATTTATSYTDSTVPQTGETYYYQVRAYDKAGNESAGTADRAVTTVDRTPPAAPSGLKATSTRTANTLSWQAVPGAASYEVVRAPAESGPYQPIATVAGATSYTDAGAPMDVPVAYKVRALDAAGNTSAYSAAIMATRDTVAPAAPQNLTVAAQDEGGVTLTWVSGGSDAVRYNIYRADTSIGASNKIGQTSNLFFRDTTGDAGQMYAYYVTAVDAAGNESTWTRVAAVRTVGPSSVPKAPNLGIARIVGDRLTLDWYQGGYVPVAGYTVYRSRTTPVDTHSPGNVYATTTGTSYTATVGAGEQGYYYAVVANSTYGVRSAASNSVLPSVSEVQPPLPTQVYEVTPGDGQVQLIWGAVPIGPGEPAIVGYRVYRSTRPGVTKDNAEATFYVNGNDRYTDTGLSNGTTYYYAIASVNAAGLESSLSPEVSATPKA